MKTISIQQTLGFFTSCTLALALAALAAGCQQPYRCGARDEPCCNFEGVAPCIADLGLSCNAGVCQTAMRTACPAPGQRCDVGLQNCAAGQSCQVVGSSTQCATAGTGTDGAPCADETQCAPGHFCAIAGNVCRRYCCGELGCGANQFCLNAIDGSGVGFCVQSNCDVLAQTGCLGAACYPVGRDDGSVLSICLTAGSAAVGESCSGADSCVPGAACFGSTCRQICRPSDPSCETGTCMAIEGGDDLGGCF